MARPDDVAAAIHQKMSRPVQAGQPHVFADGHRHRTARALDLLG
jgi:hypothetical protein